MYNSSSNGGVIVKSFASDIDGHTSSFTVTKPVKAHFKMVLGNLPKSCLYGEETRQDNNGREVSGDWLPPGRSLIEGVISG